MMSEKPNLYAIDEDNPEWTQDDFNKAMTPDDFEAKTGIKLPRRGRPKSTMKKIHTGLRLDAEVIAHFKGDNPKGWQTRINAALRKVAGL